MPALQEDRATILDPKMPAERYCPDPYLRQPYLLGQLHPYFSLTGSWITGGPSASSAARIIGVCRSPDEQDFDRSAHQASRAVALHANYTLCTQ